MTKKGIVKFFKENKGLFIQLSIMLIPQIAMAMTAGGGGASTGLGSGLDNPLNALNGAMTGAVPKVGVTIAAAAGATSWALGTENQVTKYALRAAMGGGIAMAAPSTINAVTGTSTGFLFF